MNCKNSAQNALKVAIFRLKIENFSGEGQYPHWGGGYPLAKPHPSAPSAPRYSRLRRSTLAPSFANPGSATGCRAINKPPSAMQLRKQQQLLSITNDEWRLMCFVFVTWPQDVACFTTASRDPHVITLNRLYTMTHK